LLVRKWGPGSNLCIGNANGKTKKIASPGWGGMETSNLRKKKKTKPTYFPGKKNQREREVNRFTLKKRGKKRIREKKSVKRKNRTQ